MVVFEDTNEVEIGVIVRNGSGKVIVALFEKIDLPSSLEVEVLETLAA